jgi:sugar-specific transcriptional regulator TrmB
MNKAESLLKDIGMREYEAKAFVSIVQCGVCSAEQISKMSNIPLTRVYETMQSLQKLGVVTVLNTRPKKYRLVSVDALSNLIERKRRSLEMEIERSAAIIKEVKSIVPKASMGDSEEIREGFWIFKGRETALRKILEEEKKSGKEILYFSDDFSWFPRFKKTLEEKLSNGVSVKVLININEHTADVVKQLMDLGAEVRGWDVRGLRGDIIDGNMIHLVSKISR